MENRNSPLYLYWPLTMTLLMWGFMNVPTAFALAEMAPLQLLLLRTAIAVLILAPLARLRDGLLLPLPGDRITAALMGLSGVFFNNVFFFNAMKRTSLTNVAILFATSPFITAVLARIFLGERLTLRRVLGIVIALAGCYQGMRCGRSALAVGQATTTAVVHSIVGIIVTTAIITLMCNVLGI